MCFSFINSLRKVGYHYDSNFPYEKAEKQEGFET